MPVRNGRRFVICGAIAALGISIVLAAAQQPARSGPFTAEQAAATGGPSVQVPVDLGAEVVVYHLTLPGGGRLIAAPELP